MQILYHLILKIFLIEIEGDIKIGLKNREGHLRRLDIWFTQ